ncbi:MAG: sigma-54-dependent Fis family transcriptional regulator [Desulfobulbaceae bacterium]|nr:sigma-54-dependent Fis family transcriptional regulator [Desulfobulbaceae bacterium]
MSKEIHVLIVDDDSSILEVLDARLTAAGFTTHKSASGAEALELLKKKSIDVLVSDIKMPEMSGLELLEETRIIFPKLPVIFLTAYGTIPDAVDALKAGAVDYLTKPFDGKELVRKIEDIIAVNPQQPIASKAEDNEGIAWGKSVAMAELKEMLLKVAASNANVLILGESGVGKECVARMLHNSSPRKNKPYMVVDCGSTPSGILESELFGHVKGSFTHAIQDKKGLIEAAHGGTLFLDEVGNISQEMQSRLLRFLEERTIRQVGAIKEKEIDCRVISATNADLKADADEGKFRLDLYYRLKVVTLLVPPLRERSEDIPELAQFLVDSYNKKNNLPSLKLPQKTMDWLQTLSWPGNVRELKNALETGIILCENNQILPEDLQLDNEPIAMSKSGDSNFSIEQSEKEAIIRALKQTKGVKKDAAELLGISRRAIQYKSKKYNLDSSQFKS